DIRNESFEAGANDYLSRPFSPEELLGRIRVQLRLRQLQEDLRRANERHRRLGSHDELTGLANRRHLLDLCRRELSRSRRHKLAMTVAVVDIDHFRSLSKSIGPLAGDAIITEMASVLGRNLRTADVLARVAPQKFAVMLPHTDGAQGRAAGERLRSAACNHPYPGHRPGDVTVCVGVATYPSGRLESVDELVNAAESSLERARDLGGDRVEVWADEA
ncbi:MAG: diguanylate cyclase, partial [Myxococcota bacterium]